MSYFKIISKRVPLDNKYENVISFKNLLNEEGTIIKESITRDNFFLNYDEHYNNLTYYKQVNFKYGDSINTDLKIVDTSFGDTANALMGLNYVHIINNENSRYPENLYYFITDVRYLNGHIVDLILELDIFTTYFGKTKITSKNIIETKRCHCDRFSYKDKNVGKYVLGCDEALLPDKIDSQFNANILKYREKVDFGNTNGLWVVIYINTSLNIENLENVLAGNIGTDTPYLYCYKNTNQKSKMFVKNLPTPYYILPIPLESITIKYQDSVSTSQVSFKYGFNEEIPIPTSHSGSSPTEFKNYTLYNFLMEKYNTYIHSIQLVNFDFGNYLGMYNTDGDLVIQNNNSCVPYFLCTAVDNYEFLFPCFALNGFLPSMSLFKTFKYVDILRLMNGAGIDLYRDTLNDVTYKEYMYEPKLYTSPYSHLSITSATEKEVEFEPFLAQENIWTGHIVINHVITFEKTFTPSPISSGEMTFIKTGKYSLYKNNYMGSAPTINSEIPFANSEYANFLATQKNSYYTGMGISFFNNIMGVGSGVASTIYSPTPSGKAGGLISTTNSLGNLVSQPFMIDSKMKDLKNAPTKFNSNNFDIYSIMTNCDVEKYLNVYTLLDKEKDKCFDFYYRFGYQVEMERKITYNDSLGIIVSKDNSLINRQLFNYLEIEEDITNKVEYFDNNEIPLTNLVRSRFNSLLQRGVRLWYLNNNEVNNFLDFSLENKEIN